jgi:hypothetical protein
MSQGKYSPAYPRKIKHHKFDRNAYGEIPPPYKVGVDEYDEKIHFVNYDKWGYDTYGYSAWLADGTFVGVGEGVDRLGYTEMDYLSMNSDKYEAMYYYITNDTFKIKAPGVK